MGFKRCLLPSKILGETRKFFEVTAIALALVANGPAAVSAGDLSAQPADTLSVTGAPTHILPQDRAASGSEWYSGFHMSGYASQTFGMWQNPTALKEYTKSRNNLATSRTLLQVDENYRLNENNTFFAREWFVYEPPYSFNSANNPAYGAASANHASFGHFMNGFYNNYQVRDAWWENKWGPLTTFVGNQIVVWGQSLAFRVGDIVNPADTCWAFGFANLEQSRNAQWMIHPVLNLPEWGPFSSNFIEGVWQPGFSPIYWPEEDGPYGIWKGESSKAGRAVTCQPAASHGPSARFDVQYVNSFRPPFNSVLIPAAGGPASGLLTGPFTNYNGQGQVAQPANREFWTCSNLEGLILGNNPAHLNFANPVPVGFRHPCHLGLSLGNNPYAPTGDHALVDFGIIRIPGFQPRNWNEGARFHTLYGATELTALYYNDNVNGLGTGTEETLMWKPYTNLWEYHFANVQEAGVTADRPLPMPSALGEYFPAVGRAEVLYVNHASFEDQSPLNFTGQGWSDVLKWMVAVDLDQAYAPWLTETGNLSANLEVFDTIVLNDKKNFGLGNDLNTNQLKNDVDVLFNIGTSWLWNDVAPTWTMIYNPKGRSFALFPSLVLNPPWTKKYFLKLQAIEVLGGDKMQNFGLFKGQSLLTAQFQYNFSVL
jgi:hypothetical protein